MWYMLMVVCKIVFMLETGYLAGITTTEAVGAVLNALTHMRLMIKV